ncbi:hypothetical protein [Acrocarpospora catenulata]|uniref:hypothetical protein n=1 Tax=Acrocarpospora catenulata TaxID=2836182 RepID=UPI001BDA7EE4|nr:hypothetical protein [Acrocarpospora catenulata]
MLILPLGVTAPAHAAYGPVEALKRQLVEHRGVTVSDRWTLKYKLSETKYVYLYKNIVEFGKGKVVATDTRYRPGNKYAGSGIFRYLTFIGRQYMQDKNDDLPAGKRWVLDEDKSYVPAAYLPIRIADPATLKAVLATTQVKRPAGSYDGTRTTLYQGTITFGDLYKAAPWPGVKKPTGKDAKDKITWRIWFGRDQLPRRVWSSWRTHSRASGGLEEVSVKDALLTGWGAKTRIAPPPDDHVVREEDLRDDE